MKRVVLAPLEGGLRGVSGHPGIRLFSIVCMLTLLSCPAAFAALEKSSKKECAICHVMWLDVFRTENETLIEWQPGNVLMKDTQGIVSSGEICYSCHDGYVRDSRHTAWKDNNHTTFKKPSEKIKIPDMLTLSNKDEIYCGTCHTPHSGREAGPGASPGETIPGPLSFMRLPNTDSGLCEACHVNEADYRRNNSHPVHTDKLKIPDRLFELGSKSARKKDTVTCQTCHQVHGAKGRNLTIMDNSKSQLCMICHEERTIAGTRHDLRLTMPEKTNVQEQPLSESGPCGACHVPHNGAGDRLWAGKTDSGNPASRICLSCHGETKKGEITGVGRHSHSIGPDAVSDDRKKTKSNPTDKLPFFSNTGKRQPDGTVQCFTCHNVHQWDPAAPDNRGGKDAKGDSSNSFLRISNSRTSALCLECHQDKAPLLSFDHNLALTAPEAGNIQGFAAEASGPCGACHIPHNAADDVLWAREVPEVNDFPREYCTGCHAENGPAKDKRPGKDDHPVNVVIGESRTPPPERLAEALPLFNTEGGTENGRHILCRTCHDPHLWSAVQTGAGSSVLAADIAEAPAKNVEGDAKNSFLRKPASPAPDLCIVCHEDTALLAGTDHDLFVTAPGAKNQMGRTVAESGQCGACHAVHNSPEKRLLWARSPGPVGDNQHPMNGLCTSCHSEGGIARDKIPPVAAHPSGQLINNIMTSDDRPTGYTHIFDPDWKQGNVGDLSCSSCHSFYKWDHRIDKPGPGINIEGDAGTSFLRAPSGRTVCIDCHGETAVWRYTYFHSLEKREMLKGKRP